MAYDQTQSARAFPPSPKDAGVAVPVAGGGQPAPGLRIAGAPSFPFVTAGDAMARVLANLKPVA